jgi:CHAT domain-containing protein
VSCHRQPSFEVRFEGARLKLQQGYVDVALREAKQGYSDTETDQLWNQRFRLLQAEALTRLGRPGEALSLLKTDPPSGVTKDISARRKILQAQALCQSGAFPEGESRLKQAETLLGSSDQMLLAESALVRGKCAWSESNVEVAQENFHRAERLAEHQDHFIRASALGNLGVLLMNSDHYVEAVDTFQALLGLVEPMNSPILKEKALGSLGECYAELGDWRQSLRFSQEAADIAAEINNRRDQETWLIDQGRAHFSIWELPEAEKSYLEALSIAQERDDRIGIAACFNNLSRLALRRGDLVKGEEYLERGKALKVESEDLHFALDAAEIAVARKQFATAERLLLAELPRTAKNAELRFMVQRDLGKLYWDQNRLIQADQLLREGIATAERALAKLSRPESRMSFMDRIPFFDPYIQFLAAQKRLVESLRVAERSRAQVLLAALENDKKSKAVLAVPVLQSLLKTRNQIALAYSLTDEESFLWVITPKRFKMFRLPGHASLFWQIDAFNREIQDHRDIKDSPAGAKLYETLIRPAEKLVPKGSKVVVIPSKLLSLVNFEALIVPGPQPHYWIEDVDVQVSGSLALLGDAKSSSIIRRPKTTRQLLALGAPVEASKDFPALRFAPAEMQRVEDHFSVEQRVVVSGKEATPAAYRANDPGQYRFIHLDTHGVANDLSPLDSAIILSPDANKAYKLYAHEIKDIPLHADVITISACYGAGTRWYQGEGIVGLAWAFLRAGAHQVVAALWEVDDASSPQLMDDFYSELTQGKSAAEALRDAKLKMLHSSDFHRHPYYWASLQLYTGS